MSREVDERIVAMYFDNKDFEKNARNTIQTLDELKKGLDLEGAAKGLDTLQKAGKALNFDRLNTSAKNLRNTLSGISDLGKKAFGGLTAPLQAMENAFNNFRGYVGKVVGFDIASKLVGGIENALREVTIQPITAGWSEYELKMDSIKTIMSGSGESLEVVKDKLEELNTYADKTIYSFSDMTSSIGKFTNNGVKLDEATAAIKGIANATADAGQGAQQASMAMYNISQALGVGSMKLIDWKSLENANIATSKLKTTFLQLGGALGQLKKYTDKDGNIHYFAADDKNAKKVNEKKIAGMNAAEVKAYLEKLKVDEITAENFRESLNKDWLNKEVLLKTLQVYSGDELDMDTIMSWGFSEDEAKELMKIGEEASKAATEVRTFSKMWDALKESAQSGWAQSIEFIFGDMEEGTKLWTELNGIFSGILESSADNRNNVLMAWRGLERQEDGTIRAIEGAIDGRQVLIDGVMDIIGLFQDVGKMFGEASEKVFGKMTGEKLLELTQRFRDFAHNIREWLGDAGKLGTRMNKLQKGLQGVFSILKTGANFIKIIGNLVKRLAGPAIELLIDMFGKFGEFFDGMGDMDPGKVFEKIGKGIGDLWTKLKGLFSVGEDGSTPISKHLKKLWDDLKKVIRDWANENGLGGVLDGVVGVWDTITGWEGWTKISDAFNSAKTAISDAWNSLSGWEGWEEIGKFFTNIWDWFTKKISRGDTSPTQGPSELKAATDSTVQAIKDIDGEVPNEGKTGFVVWLENVAKTLNDAWNKISNWEGWEKLGTFFSDVWTWIKEKTNMTIDWFSKPTEDGKTGFIIWIEGIADKLTSAWNSIAKWEFWDDVGKFFGDVWSWIEEKAEVTVNWFKMGEDGTDSGFVTWLKSIGEAIKGAWDGENGIKNWPGWDEIGQFLSDTWGWVMGLFTDEESGEASADDAAANAKKAKDAIEETVNMAPDEQKVGILERILTAISNFWDTVSSIAGGITVDPTVQAIWDTIGSIVETIAVAIKRIVEAIHDVVVNNDIGGLTKLGWLGIIGAAVAVVVGFFKRMKTKRLMAQATIAENAQSFGLQLLEIAGAVALIAGAVAALSALDEGKAWSAIGKIAVIGGVLVGLMMAANKWIASADGVKQQEVTAVERIVNNVVKWLGIAGTIKIVMDSLPTVISTIASVPNFNGSAMMSTMLSVVTLVAGVGLVFTAVQKMTGGGGLNPKATAMTALSIVAGVAILFTGLEGVLGLIGGIAMLGGKNNVEGVVQNIEAGGKIMNAVGQAVFSFFAGLFGQQSLAQKQDEAQQQLDWLLGMGDSFDAEKLAKLGTMINLISRIAGMDFEGYNFDHLTNSLPDMGTALAGFAQNIETITAGENGKQKIQDMLDMVIVLQGFANAMNAISESLFLIGHAGWDEIDEIFEDKKLNSIMDLYTKAAEKLAKAIQEGLGEEGNLTFDATPIVDSIVVALGLGESRIAKAVHDMVQQGMIFAENGGEEGPGYKLVTDTTEAMKDLSGALDLDSPNSIFGGLTSDRITSLLYGDDGKSGLVGTMQSAVGDLQGTENLGDVLAEKLGGSVITNANGDETTMLTELTEQLTGLSDSLQALPPIEVKITPVFDMSNMTRDQLQSQLNQQYYGLRVNMGNLSGNFDSSAIVTSVNGVSAKMDLVMQRISLENAMNRTAIASMSSHIDGIARAVSGIRIVLNTGALVGALTPGIDFNLGNRAAIAGRTGVTPKWGNIPSIGYDMGNVPTES